MKGKELDCTITIGNLILACKRLLEVFEEYGYLEDGELLKGVRNLTWILNAEIDWRRRFDY
jgi:hypothetical protein